jgi:hypothetical protein
VVRRTDRKRFGADDRWVPAEGRCVAEFSGIYSKSLRNFLGKRP